MDPHDPDGSTDEPTSPDDEHVAASSPAPGSPPSTPVTSMPPPPTPPPGSAAPGSRFPGAMWTPPDAGAAAGTGLPAGVQVEDADGPPTPPPVRRRRRRRRWALTAVSVVVVIGAVIVLAVLGTFSGEQAPSAGGDEDREAREDDAPDGDVPGGDSDDGEGAVAPPDVEVLEGEDAVYGRLLADIDVSERVMVSFQDGVANVFSAPAGSSDELVEALQELGAEGRDDLLAVRDRFDDELDVDGADEIRERYVAHLDSWADYMDAVSDDPSVLAGEGASAGFTVAINATADAFARALREELPDDADPSIREYAEDLLDRGFRNQGDAQV